MKNEFCRQVEEGGGIELINEIMTTYMNNDVSFSIVGDVYLFNLFIFVESDKTML